MPDVYGVSYIFKDVDGNMDLTTETIVAENDYDALGWSMIEGVGNEITSAGGVVVMVHTAMGVYADIREMVLEREEKEKPTNNSKDD